MKIEVFSGTSVLASYSYVAGGRYNGLITLNTNDFVVVNGAEYKVTERKMNVDTNSLQLIVSSKRDFHSRKRTWKYAVRV